MRWTLTLSPPIPLRLYTLPYWSYPLFLIFDIRALWRSGLSATAPECQKLKIAGKTSMALNPLNSSSLEQLALKGLNDRKCGSLFMATEASRDTCITCNGRQETDVAVRAAVWRPGAT